MDFVCLGINLNEKNCVIEWSETEPTCNSVVNHSCADDITSECDIQMLTTHTKWELLLLHSSEISARSASWIAVSSHAFLCKRCRSIKVAQIRVMDADTLAVWWFNSVCELLWRSRGCSKSKCAGQLLLHYSFLTYNVYELSGFSERLFVLTI